MRTLANPGTPWIVLLVTIQLVGLPPRVATAQSAVPRTGAESADWARRTSHAEVVSFLGELRSRTDRMLTRTIGHTEEGREISAVFLGDPVESSSEAILRSEKPTLLVTGSIHGNEPAGTEGALQLIRDLTLGDRRDLLRAVNVIVVPEMNPDGSEAGTRENARGYDLNRDWVTAETREVGAVLDELVIPYWPDVFVDVHNGGSLPYHLTYQTSLEPAAHSGLVALARGAMFDFVEARLQARGMEMFWYSGPSYDERDGRWYWRTTEPLPRKQHSYAGLQDMIALLFEIPEGHALRVGADAAREGMLGLVEYLAENPEEVKRAVRSARNEAMEMPPDEIYLALGPRPYPEAEEFYVMTPPSAGADAMPELVSGDNRTRFSPIRVRPAPWGYVLDPELEDVQRLLRRHGIQVERLDQPVSLEVERYRLERLTRARDRYQRHFMSELRVEMDSGLQVLPEGALLVRVRQRGGRIIPQLLEPDAVDSVARWNFLDAYLPRPGSVGSYLPIVRLLAPPGVPTTLLP